MRYAEHDDRELVELAKVGWQPAFAVLVHRHAAELLAAHAKARDPQAATVKALSRAMRRLDRYEGAGSFASWVMASKRRTVPAEVPPREPAEIDALWDELRLRWPDGRRPRRVPVFVKGLAVAVAAIALGIAVPVALIRTPAPADGARELRAQRIEEESVDAEPDDLDEPEPIVTFEFPDIVLETPAAPPPSPPTTTPTTPPPTTPDPSPSPPPTEPTDDAGEPTEPTDDGADDGNGDGGEPVEPTDDGDDDGGGGEDDAAGNDVPDQPQP